MESVEILTVIAFFQAVLVVLIGSGLILIIKTLTGLATLVQWTKQHQELDDERYEGLDRRLGSLDTKLAEKVNALSNSLIQFLAEMREEHK